MTCELPHPSLCPRSICPSFPSTDSTSPLSIPLSVSFLSVYMYNHNAHIMNSEICLDYRPSYKRASPKDIPKTVIFCRRTLWQYFTNTFVHFPRSQIVSMFHASLTDETKKSIYSKFTSSTSTLRCLISSIAFGMVSTNSNSITIN